MNETECSSSLGQIPWDIYILCHQTSLLRCDLNASTFKTGEHFGIFVPQENKKELFDMYLISTGLIYICSQPMKEFLLSSTSFYCNTFLNLDFASISIIVFVTDFNNVSDGSCLHNHTLFYNSLTIISQLPLIKRTKIRIQYSKLVKD